MSGPVDSVKHRWTLGLLGSSRVEPFLAALDVSVSRKIDKIKCGFWDQITPIILVTSNQTRLDSFMQNKFFKRHQNFRILSPSSRKGFILQSQYHFWDNSWVNQITEITEDKELFTSPSFDLNGYKLDLTFMPSSLDNINFYTDQIGERKHFGIMYEIVETIVNSLNATFSLQVPPDEQWGAINNNGKIC